jgi:hypothetical protein
MRHTLALLAALPTVALAAPETVLSQGRLLDPSGAAISGTRDLTFSLFDAEDGLSARWSETHLGVPVEDGYYAVALGGVDPLDADALLGDRWLAVSVGGVELSRAPLHAAPWAVRAAGLTLSGEAGGAVPGACAAAEVGTVRYNTDRDTLEFCRNNGGAPAWTGVAFVDLAGNDAVGRTFADGSTAASCAAYKADFRYQGAATGSGMYWITPQEGLTLKVWCDMDTAPGAWLDVVKSYHGPGADPAALTAALFSGQGTITGTPATNTSSVKGVLLYSNQAASHQVSYWLDKDVIPYSAVGLGYRLQGSANSSRCSSTSWVPLNGPGWNGGDNGYLASCPSGFSCIQGSSTTYRDAPIHVPSYTNDAIASNQILTWSGSSVDGDSTIPGCSDDPEIPSTQPMLWIYDLRLR